MTASNIASSEKPEDDGSSLAMGFGFGTVTLFAAIYIIGIGVVPDNVEFLKFLAIKPKEPASLFNLLTYGFGHLNWQHLALNMLQICIMAVAMIHLTNWKSYIGVSVTSLFGAGLLAWFAAPEGFYVVGSSGIMAGLASYLVLRASAEKQWKIFTIAIVFLTLTVIGVVATLLAVDATTSWHAHVGGMLVGVILASVHLLQKEKLEQKN